MTKPTTYRLYTILAIGVLSVSFAAIFIRLADAEPAAIAFYRMGLAAILLLPWALKQRQGFAISKKQMGAMLGAGAFLALHFLFWITSLDYTSVTTSVVLVTIQPIFVAIASTILLKERPSSRLLVGLILAALGAGIIATTMNNRIDTGYTGVVLALFGALMAAGYILVGRVARRKMPVGLYACSVYGISAIFLGIYAIVGGIPLVGYTSQTWTSLVLLALVPTFVGHTAFNWALEYVPAPVVSISIMGEPVGSTILAMFILREFPVFLEIVGGIIILLGIITALYRNNGKGA